MTGKELLIAFVGAGLVGGAAGVAASLAAGQKPDAVPQPSPEVLHRLKAAEDELAKTRAALEVSRQSVNELTERVTTGELKAARLAADAASQPVAVAPAKGVRVGRRTRGGDAKGDDSHADIQTALGQLDLGEAGGQIAMELGKAFGDLGGGIDLEGLGKDLPAQFGAFRAGLALRQLPEADRWNKAKDELGLDGYQVEELKRAVTTRDAALKDAMTTETKTGPNGGTLTIQRPDAAKAAHAQADYHDKVNSTLHEDQRKGWSDKGYENAFGSHPFGGAGNVVMAIDVSSEHGKDEAPKDSPK